MPLRNRDSASVGLFAVELKFLAKLLGPKANLLSIDRTFWPIAKHPSSEHRDPRSESKSEAKPKRSRDCRQSCDLDISSGFWFFPSDFYATNLVLYWIGARNSASLERFSLVSLFLYVATHYWKTQQIAAGK